MYCVRCGRKLPREYNKCRKCREDARPNAWYCPSCGNGVKEIAKECDVCGEKLKLSPAMYVLTPRPDNPRSRKKAAALAFVGGSFGMHYLYLGFRDKFKRRAIWAGVSILVALAFLVVFRISVMPAFANGEVNAELLAGDDMTFKAVSSAVCICAGILSFIIAFISGICNGIILLKGNNQRDADGEKLL